MTPHDLHLGVNALSQEKLTIPWNELTRHWHLLGRTGVGKSRAAEIFCRHIVDSQHALILLDGKGDLFETVRDYCIAAGYEDRMIVVDPTCDEWAVGLNYLEVVGNTSPAVLAELVTEGLKRNFGEEHEFKPLLEEWVPPCVLPLIKANMTLVELEDFASIGDPSLRSAVLDSLGSEAIREKRKWSELRSFGTHEAAIRTAVVRTRAALIRQSPMAEAMFGQKKTIHWGRVLDEGGIVLIRAHPHPKVSERLATLIGTTVIHQVSQAARSRSADERPDAFLVCDEFQEYCCSDFVRGLAQLRSFHLWLLLANQELKQLERVPGLKEAVLAECTGKIYFSVSHQDAEETYHELFQDVLIEDKIKEEIWQTKFRPHESTRKVESETHGKSHFHTDSVSRSQSEGEVSSYGSAFSDQYGNWFILPARWFPWNRSGSSWSKSESNARISSESMSKCNSHSEGTTHSKGNSVVPWYEYIEFQELSSRTYYSISEICERLKHWLMGQDARNAKLKIGNRRTIPIITRTVHEASLGVHEVATVLGRIFKRSALPTSKVRKEIAERSRLYIEQYSQRKALEEARLQERDTQDAKPKVQSKKRKGPSRWE